MAYENTGKALAVRWDYVKGGATTTQKLLNTAGAELESTDIYLLTDEEYTACFNYTVNYMKNTLKWQEVPSLSTSIKTDLVLCPLPTPPPPAPKIIEVKFETYSADPSKYRIFFASKDEIPTDIQIDAYNCVADETSTISVTSSIIGTKGYPYEFYFDFATKSVEKLIGDTLYRIIPFCVVLPNPEYLGKIFDVSFLDVSSVRPQGLIERVRGTALSKTANGVTVTSEGTEFRRALNNGYGHCMWYLPLDLRYYDYTMSGYIKFSGGYETLLCRESMFRWYPSPHGALELNPKEYVTGELNGFFGFADVYGNYGMYVPAQKRANEWIHYVGQWNHADKTFSLYIDKVLQGKTTPTKDFFRLGGGMSLCVDDRGSTSQVYTVTAKNFVIYDRLLTQSEINAL